MWNVVYVKGYQDTSVYDLGLTMLIVLLSIILAFHRSNRVTDPNLLLLPKMSIYTRNKYIM